MSRLLALDIGTRRTGVAYCDEAVGIPLPLPTLAHRTREEFGEMVAGICRDRSIDRIVVGLPLLPSGDEGEQSQIVRDYVEVLSPIGLPITYKDERYTTARRVSGQAKKRFLAHSIDDNAESACLLLASYLCY